MEEKSVFETLNAVNVNEKVEKKQDLTYLSWAWAWSEVKKRYPDADYKIFRFGDNQWPFIYVEELGMMCWTSVTIRGETKEMWLPVMDGANKAMRFESYDYYVKNPNFKYAKLNPESGKYFDRFGNEQKQYIEKTCEAATMYDVNKTIMRCLVKNLAMFGLGLYIYAGEDLPEDETLTQPQSQSQMQPQPTECITQEQYAVFHELFSNERIAKMCAIYHIDSVEQLPATVAQQFIDKERARLAKDGAGH